jgi:hypothetical protein
MSALLFCRSGVNPVEVPQVYPATDFRVPNQTFNLECCI